MKKVIKKWEIILQQDSGRDITYGRKILEEILTDVKIAVKNNAVLPIISECFNDEDFITNVCLSYRHDYGLLSDDEINILRFECKEWMRAIVNNWDNKFGIENNILGFVKNLNIPPVSISKEDIQWVVNDSAELGVKIVGKFFWLYKGESLDYTTHDDDTPIKYRQVGKREFGECCHPLHLKRLPERYTEGEGWQEC